jgi:EpsD family peptidyl-prolyl cis-trans isomerase
MTSTKYPWPTPARIGAVCLSVLALTLSAACSDKKKEPAASQTAVKVNKDELTVHQINFVLQQQRGLRPEQTEAASQQILERLIDQQLALQKADDLRIDRDPRVVQQLEAARRDIIARAYLERVGEAAPKPTPEEISKYFQDKPALFAERRVYSFQELTIEADAKAQEALRAKLATVKNLDEFVAHLRAEGVRFNANQAVRAAEQLPLATLDTFARMKDGQVTVVPSANAMQVILLAGSRVQPVSEEQARPAIEQFILNERKRKLVEDDRKALRAAARIEYVGKFAERAASAPGAPVAAAAPVAVPPAAVAPVAAGSAAGGMSAADISKGMGLK